MLVSLFTDNGGEFIGLTSYRQKNALTFYHSTTYCWKNGFTERHHWHIVETDMSLVHHAQLPSLFGIMHSKWRFVSWIIFPLLSLTLKLHMINFTTPHLTIWNANYLAAYDSRGCNSILHLNFSPVLLNVSFLVTYPLNQHKNVIIPPPIAFSTHAIWSLLKIFFHTNNITKILLIFQQPITSLTLFQLNLKLPHIIVFLLVVLHTSLILIYHY